MSAWMGLSYADDGRKATMSAQACTAHTMTGEPECTEAAEWVWQPAPAESPVYLCASHARPFGAVSENESVAPIPGLKPLEEKT